MSPFIDPRHKALTGQSGSALAMVLFACLSTAVVIQALSATVLCAEGAAIDESTGRGRLAEKDGQLAALRQHALTDWTPGGWRTIESAAGSNAAGEGALSEVSGGDGWILKAAVRQAPDVSPLTLTAYLERGRDGIDLPRAAAVAERMTAALGRLSPWVETEDAGPPGQGAPGLAPQTMLYVTNPLVDAVLGQGCMVAPATLPWRLDDGWAYLVVGGSETLGSGASWDAGVKWVEGRFGVVESLPSGDRGRTPDDPLLLVLTGGAILDARDRGDMYAVLVVDDGSVLLDGTTVHGAVFATHTIDLGGSGEVVYSPLILRWATDRSLNRVRLVPGSRGEGMD